MSVRNGFKKKRLMRRADSTYITMWLLCKLCINYADKGGWASTGTDGCRQDRAATARERWERVLEHPADKAAADTWTGAGPSARCRTGGAEAMMGRREGETSPQGRLEHERGWVTALEMLLLWVGWVEIVKRRKTRWFMVYRKKSPINVLLLNGHF